MQLALAMLVCAPLIACWYSDVSRGIVPDVFTLLPLAALIVVALVLHTWEPIVAALVVAFPFALAASLSHGLGMGWGDVKLVALGGAVLGIEDAVLACMVACGLAILIAWLRGKGRDPVAFAPYLVGSIALFLSSVGIA